MAGDPAAEPRRRRGRPADPLPGGGGDALRRRRGHRLRAGTTSTSAPKGDDTVWDYDTRAQSLRPYYQAERDPARQLVGVDNLTVSRAGDVVVAEDGGNMELVLLTPEGGAAPLVRVIGQNGSELAGPSFRPFRAAGSTLSSQRGGQGGITYDQGALPAPT